MSHATHTTGRRIGREWHVHDRLASTNALALELLEGAPDGLVVQAREQTAGRGQHGRSWLSPPDTSILLSVIVFPPERIRRPVLLTAWAALAVCRVIEPLGVEPAIKWPNDVLIGGKKVCGILIEQARGTVVGIGLNLSQGSRTFRDAGLTEATSLALATGRRDFPLLSWTARLLEALDDTYEALLTGPLGGLEAEWRGRLGLLGRDVSAECHAGTLRGRVVALGFDGVELCGEDGAVRRVVPETIRHLTPVGG